MAIKDLALLKVVGSIIKKGKDKIVTIKDKGISSSGESVFDTFKKAMSKPKPIKHEELKVEVDTKTEEKLQVEKSTQKKKDTKKTVEKVTPKSIENNEKVSTAKKEEKVVKKEISKVETKTEKIVEKESPKTPVSKKAETPKAKPTSKKEPTKTEQKAKTESKDIKKENKKTTKAPAKPAKKVEKKELKDKTAPATPIKSTKKEVKKEASKPISKAPTAKKTVAKKEPVTKVKTTTAKKPTAPSKKEEKIAKYTKDIEKHLGNVDAPFLDILVKNLGPSIYRRDAESVSCFDDKELATVRNNFLIKKLGYDKKDNNMLDAEIKKVCEALKGTKVKYRATFYYMLAKNLKKESALS